MTRTLPALVTALACVGLLAACGNASSTSSSGPAAASAAGSASTRSKLAACLKAHGVTLPARPAGAARRRPPGGYGAPGGGGSFFGGGAGGAGGPGGLRSNPKFQAAFKACGAAFPRRTRVSAAAHRAQVTKFVTCVRQHGYKLPAPNFSGKGAIFPAKIATDAKFRAAAKPCTSLLRPSGAPGAAGGTPGGASTSSAGASPST
jgi:hypothetical protein